MHSTLTLTHGWSWIPVETLGEEEAFSGGKSREKEMVVAGRAEDPFPAPPSERQHQASPENVRREDTNCTGLDLLMKALTV
jgi:hypothetical protein